MAAISSNNETQTWKKRAIRRAVVITDAWDVFNVYAGRLAAWVLFTCVILNVIEIMPFVHFSALVVGSIMGVQAITLDVAGNGMLALADHAREEGREADARSATTLGKWLIFIMIVTVALVCVSTLWTPLAPYIAQAENGLILVRVVLSVVYLSVLKRLSRHDSPALSLSQVATLEQRMQSQVEAISQASRQSLVSLEQSVGSLVSQKVAQILATSSQRSSQLVASEVANFRGEVANEVAQILATQVASLRTEVAHVTALQVAQIREEVARKGANDGMLADHIETLTEQVAQMASLMGEAKRQFRAAASQARVAVTEVPTIAPAPTSSADESDKPGDRVRAFLTQWSSQSGSQKPPTLQAIMDTCKVAKKTATFYRDQFYGLATSSQPEESE